MTKNIFYIFIVLLLSTGCTNNGVQSEVEIESLDLIVGESNLDLVEILIDEPVNYSLNNIEENEEFILYSTNIDLQEDDLEDIYFNVWSFKEDGRQLMTVKSQATSEVSIIINQTVENRFNVSDGKDFRVPIIAKGGEIIKENKILRLDSDGNVTKTDSLIWTQNEELFAVEIIRNQAYSPAGINTINSENNFIPFRMDSRIGWIDFEIQFQETTKIYAIKVNEIVLSKS